MIIPFRSENRCPSVDGAEPNVTPKQPDSKPRTPSTRLQCVDASTTLDASFKSRKRVSAIPLRTPCARTEFRRELRTQKERQWRSASNLAGVSLRPGTISAAVRRYYPLVILPLLVQSGCVTMDSDNLTQGGIAHLHDASEKASIFQMFALGKTYENFLARTETGTLAIQIGSHNRFDVLERGAIYPLPGTPRPTHLYFVINHRNNQPAGAPGFLAVNFIQVLPVEDPQAGLVKVFRNGRLAGSWESIPSEDDATRALPKLPSTFVPETSMEDFSRRHESGAAIYQPVVGESGNVWHAKVVGSQTTTWGVSREDRLIWNRYLSPENIRRSLKRLGSIPRDAGYLVQSHIYRFSETDKHTTDKPLLSDITLEHSAMAVIVQTWAPNREDYSGEYILTCK